jgi:signal transduction histidine kinase
VRGSIRVRITLAAVLIVGVAFAIGGVLLVRAHRSALIGGVEDAARLRARDIMASLHASDFTARIAAPSGDEHLVQVVDSAGRVVAASPNVQALPRLSHLSPGRDGDATETVDHLPIGDTPFRVVAQAAQAHGERFIIYVAGGLESVARSTSNLERLLLIALPLMLAVVGLVAWFLTGRALRPVEAIRKEVEVIGAGDLHRRVPEPATGDEIERLAHTMNGMLTRLDAASEKQRRFVADASHELRSPLTGIRAQLEVSIGYPGRGDRAAIDREMLVDTIRLQRLVDDLLVLSTADNGNGPKARRVPVDLDAIVLREARRVRARTPHRVETQKVSGAQVVGDPDQLTRVVRNLFDNAARHATSTITVTLAETEAGAEMTVADDGPGIPVADRDRIFERFARLDDARARDNGGAGLGLAITHAIVTAHGGSITIDNVPGACFTVTLP